MISINVYYLGCKKLEYVDTDVKAYLDDGTDIDEDVFCLLPSATVIYLMHRNDKV